MGRSLLADSFDHHVWATLRLIDACLPLDEGQLATDVPGTYGSIIETFRHLVGCDSWFLLDITGDAARNIDPDEMDLPAPRRVVEIDEVAWSDLLAADPDPERVVREVDESDGSARDATMGIRLAVALYHGTDHRSQICTTLTSLGVEPPSLTPWDFGAERGGVTRYPPRL